MSTDTSREAARIAFEALLIARHWPGLKVVRVILPPPPVCPYAAAAARTFADPAWHAQNAALDAIRAEFPGSDGKLAQPQIEGEPIMKND